MDPDYHQHFRSDPILSKLAENLVPYNLEGRGEDLLEDLIRSIANQQLSGKAAARIYGRFKALLPTGRINPREILKLTDEQMRSAGFSRPKIKYIKGSCQAVIDKSIDLISLTSKSDDEVITELVKLNGVGKWTAEMILIFSLKRPDVFSVGDLGLRNAIAKHYQIDRDDLAAIEKLSRRWSPYRSMAALLLWKSLETPSKTN